MPYTDAQARCQMQQAYLADIEQRFAVPILEVPLLDDEVRGLERLEDCSTASSLPPRSSPDGGKTTISPSTQDAAELAAARARRRPRCSWPAGRSARHFAAGPGFAAPSPPTRPSATPRPRQPSRPSGPARPSCGESMLGTSRRPRAELERLSGRCSPSRRLPRMSPRRPLRGRLPRDRCRRQRPDRVRLRRQLPPAGGCCG